MQTGKAGRWTSQLDVEKLGKTRYRPIWSQWGGLKPFLMAAIRNLFSNHSTKPGASNKKRQNWNAEIGLQTYRWQQENVEAKSNVKESIDNQRFAFDDRSALMSSAPAICIFDAARYAHLHIGEQVTRPIDHRQVDKDKMAAAECWRSFAYKGTTKTKRKT